jgi:hypothetical protein
MSDDKMPEFQMSETKMYETKMSERRSPKMYGRGGGEAQAVASPPPQKKTHQKNTISKTTKYPKPVSDLWISNILVFGHFALHT